MYSWPKNHVFNSVIRNCLPFSNHNDCFEIDCTRSINANTFIVFSPYPKYYVYCSNDGNFATILQCPKEQDVYVNGIGCQFHCTKEGRFRDPDNDSMYFDCGYECVLKHYHLTCMNSFNSYTETCN